jgi:hypothetical protein
MLVKQIPITIVSGRCMFDGWGESRPIYNVWGANKFNPTYSLSRLSISNCLVPENKISQRLQLWPFSAFISYNWLFLSDFTFHKWGYKCL